MKIRFPLYAQILSFLLLHLAVLVVISLFLFNAQFGLGWEPLVYSPIGDRIDAIAWMISRQTQGHPTSACNNLLAEIGNIYGVKFSIFDNQGKLLAGEPIDLPASVYSHVVFHHSRASMVNGQAPQAVLTKPDSLLPPIIGRAHGRFMLHTSNPDSFWIGVRMRLRQLNGRSPVLPATLLAVSNNLWQSRLFRDFGLFLIAIIAILFLSVLIWLPFVYRITHALSTLTATAEKIAEGRFDISLNGSDWDEIGSLTQAINSMAKRLNSFVTGQKRFLGDIAHELCSPVARLQVALELLDNFKTTNQESSIQDIREEVEEMSNLINELLAFSKAGLTQRKIELVCLDLESMLKAVIARTCPDDLISWEITPGIQVLGDQLLLERALSNILRNAVRYAGNCGPIAIKTARIGKEISITISDCGPGVPPDTIRMLGEPFFRPEPSRNRSSGGVGLGLAIVKACVEACDGSFRVRNHLPSGLEVEIKLKPYSKIHTQNHVSTEL